MSCVWVLVLPDPEDAVDHAVVEVEGWVGGGDEEVLLVIFVSSNVYVINMLGVRGFCIHHLGHRRRYNVLHRGRRNAPLEKTPA